MAIEEIGPQTLKEKDAAITSVMKELDKTIGPKTLIRMGDKVIDTLPVISTGNYLIDYDLLMTGGMPRGRVIEIFGPESSGKTSIALATIAAAQKSGGRAAFVDVEHALDPAWATTLGVNVDDLLVSQPDCAENALTIVEKLVESRAIDVIVVDSVAALVPKAELQGQMGEAVIGLQARLMGQAMRKLVGPTAKSGTVLIFINQLREKIGVTYGSNETTSGGKALRFYASVRLDVRKRTAIKDGEDVIGFQTHIKSVKNKCAKPWREIDVELYFAFGFDTVGPVLDGAVAYGVVDKAGSWFSYKGERLGQGRASVCRLLTDTPLFEEIQAALESKTAPPSEKK